MQRATYVPLLKSLETDKDFLGTYAEFMLIYMYVFIKKPRIV